MTTYELRAIGVVRSSLRTRGDAPNQGDEGAPSALLVFDAAVTAGLSDVRVGDSLVLLTWLHEADRTVLAVHPRGDLSRPLTGVFSTRSPDRPNPIGLHRVQVVGLSDAGLRVEGLEAIDGTPIVDVKPVLGAMADR